MLIEEEESIFCDYIRKMAECELPMTSIQVKLKVAQMIKDRVTSFKEGISGAS